MGESEPLFVILRSCGEMRWPNILCDVAPCVHTTARDCAQRCTVCTGLYRRALWPIVNEFYTGPLSPLLASHPLMTHFLVKQYSKLESTPERFSTWIEVGIVWPCHPLGSSWLAWIWSSSNFRPPPPPPPPPTRATVFHRLTTSAHRVNSRYRLVTRRCKFGCCNLARVWSTVRPGH